MAVDAKKKINPEAQEQPKKTVRRSASGKSPAAAKKAARTKNKKPVGEIPEDIWEQWPDEKTEDYLKFCRYRDMAYDGNPEEKMKKGYSYAQKKDRRSIRRLAQELKLKGVPTKYFELSAKYKWQERVEAYDLYIEKRKREVHEAAILKMTENHALLGEQMVKKAAERIMEMSTSSISASEVARLADVGVRIERLSRGQSTENQQISGTVAHEGTVSVHKEPEQDLSKLTDEELEQLQALLEKAQVSS